MVVPLLGIMLAGPPAPVDMSWEAPASCPDRAAVVERVDALLADTSVEREQPMQADARVSPTDDGRWTVTVEIQTDDGVRTRELTADRCETLAEAAAFVVALAVDPSVAERNDAPAATEAPDLVPEPDPPTATQPKDTDEASEGVREPPAEDSETRTAEPEPVVASGRPLKIRGLVRAGGGVDVGALPGAGGVLSVAAGILGKRYRVTIGATHRFENVATLPGESDRGGAFSLTAGDVRGCAVFVVRRFEIPACAIVELGILRADGVGAEPSESPRHLWVAVGASPGFQFVPRPWIAFGLALDGLFALRRWTFTLSDDEVHQLGVADFRAKAVVELRFPRWIPGQAGKTARSR